MSAALPSIDEALVRRLLGTQFPQWAGLPVRRVHPSGWDNRTFRLGDQLLVRLPSAARYASQVARELRWLPWLAPRLPLPIPQPLATGEPEHGYPWAWSVCRWIDGEIAASGRVADLSEFARSLAHFLHQLQGIDAGDGPPPGPHNFHRGGALSVYDDQARTAIASLAGQIDVKAAHQLWARAIAAGWHGRPVWVHGDVSAGNLLVRDGQLCAVIDFGQLCVGDPACDLAIAWTFFTDASRNTFRSALGLDDATWARARGWALWKAAIVAAGDQSNAVETAQCRHTLHELLATEPSIDPPTSAAE